MWYLFVVMTKYFLIWKYLMEIYLMHSRIQYRHIMNTQNTIRMYMTPKLLEHLIKMCWILQI